MKKNTVIFDLDGTLLNTLEDLYIAFNYAIKSFGYPTRTKEEIRSFVGNGTKKAIERAINEVVEKEKLEKINEIFKEYYANHMYEKTKPYSGILEMLYKLKSKKFKIAVVSNKYDIAVKNLCNHYFKELVDIAIGEGYGIKKKPDPSGTLKVIKELNSTIENSIFVGDSNVDIETAQNVGIECISVTWGYKEETFLIEKGAKNLAKVPNNIIEIIEKKLYLI
ncbi:HAD family hydrolase [bacterium]|nr:HAD family hydrolase [bacterium]